MGSFALALTQSGATQVAIATTTVSPTVHLVTATPQPTVLPGTPSPTTAPSSTPTLTSTPIPPTNCAPPTGWEPYSSRSGDTLESLAVKFSTTIEEIIRVNCMPGPGLKPNTIIYLPVLLISLTPTPTASATHTPIPCGPPIGWTTYTVRSGDTLFHLAWAYNTTVQALQSANCMGGSDHLVAGRRIYVPNVATRTASATLATPTVIVPSRTPSLSSTPTITETPSFTPTATETDTPTITETLPLDIPSLTFTPTLDTVVPNP
jgi:LysM repeat protein